MEKKYDKPYVWPQYNPEYDGNLSECKYCGAQIYWKKSKKGNSVPVTLSTRLAHFTECNRDEQKPAPQQPEEQGGGSYDDIPF